MGTSALKTMILLTLVGITSIVSAAIGGKEKNKSNKTSTLSAKIQVGKISLRSGYEFRGNKLVSLQAKQEYISLNNFTPVKKGNKTIIVASKHTMLKPTVSVQNNNSTVEVKLLKLNLN